MTRAARSRIRLAALLAALTIASMGAGIPDDVNLECKSSLGRTR